MKVYAIASNGPLKETVFECDSLDLDVTLQTDEGIFRYTKIGYGTSTASHGIAIFAFVKREPDATG